VVVGAGKLNKNIENLGKGKMGAQENKFNFSLDKAVDVRYNVVMDATKPTSIRIPEEIISFAEEIAKAKEWSRAKVLVRSIECGLPLVGDLTLKGYQQHYDQAWANLNKAVRNGKSGGNTGEAGNHSEMDERGVGGGVEKSDTGVVLTGRVRAVVGGGSGAASGKEKGAKKGIASKKADTPAVSAMGRPAHAGNCQCFTCKPPKEK
jgi:hypothetical protein